MLRYIITEKAGRFVAGHNNPGVGTVLELTDAAAEYELTLGTIVPAVEVDAVDVQAEHAVTSGGEIIEYPEEKPAKRKR